MRTRYFQERSREGPLVAITGFDPSEVVALRKDIVQMQRGVTGSVSLDGEVRLLLQLADRDVGIRAEAGTQLYCALRALTWRGIVGLLEPFAGPNQSGYQWLDETGDVKLLISNTGEW